MTDTQRGFPLSIDVMQCMKSRSVGRLKSLESFAASSKLADVIFDGNTSEYCNLVYTFPLVQGVIIPGHQLVLCLSSDVFKQMFTGAFARQTLRVPADTGLMKLTGPSNATAAAFEIFLGFSYYWNLPTCILKQRVAPWAWTTDKVTICAIVNWITQRFLRNISQILRQPDDKFDILRVFIGRLGVICLSFLWLFLESR